MYLPGDTGSIRLFDYKYRGIFRHWVTIESNAINDVVVVRLFGYVEED